MNPLKELQRHGQAVWLDYLERGFVRNGDLKKLVDQDGLRGVTSNPAIFEKAIDGSAEYDDEIAQALREGDRSVGHLYERIAIADIKSAADVLAPVYKATDGADGYVSIEVSPYLAMDTQATLTEARRLWRDVDRRNVMIKVPATEAGLPAIRALIGDGINVNITLLFSQKIYEQVVEAYITGLEALVANGGNPKDVASVASFFVSRIDTAVDKQLDDAIHKANDPQEKARLTALKGKVAIANARLAYDKYLELFGSERWMALARKGARSQRLLWASTGTKNKAYSDVLYVDELIGPDTVNTMPPATLDAFRDHGKARDSLTAGTDDARRVLDDLARAGISLDRITDELTREGVKLFADAADKLLGALAKKRETMLHDDLDSQTLMLEHGLEKAMSEMSDRWRADGTIRKLWGHDPSVWTQKDENKWLGWLDSVAAGLADVARYETFANGLKNEFTDVLLLGMGGSSLGPEVLARTFEQKPGWPRLRIVDSTDPAQVKTAESQVDLARTLFIVSSKSGTTTEPNVLKDYFFGRASEVLGKQKAASHFVAITDPGSALDKAAKADGYRAVFNGEPTIGGRYSVLSAFGLAPGAAAGIDVKRFLERAQIMVHSCGPDVPPAANPAVQLGLAMGLAGRQGRDKVTLFCSPGVADFGAWAEQLIAESTGKNGVGLIPVDGEPIAEPDIYGSDRFFIDLRSAGETDAKHESKLETLAKAGHPVVRIVLQTPEYIGQEFFRLELAVAVAGAVLGINPFDQPDVEASKIETRDLMAAYAKTGALPKETPVITEGPLQLYADAANAERLKQAGAGAHIGEWLRAHFASLKAGDYAAFLAYLERNAEHETTLQSLRLAVRDTRHVATCLGFGPRFLHSTGQAYKGGPNTGVFLQITTDDAADLKIPGQAASFGVIKAAQAQGDLEVLAKRHRRALRVHLKGGTAAGLGALEAAVRQALKP